VKQPRWQIFQYPIRLSDDNKTATFVQDGVSERSYREYRHFGWSTVLSNQVVSFGVHEWYIKIPEGLYGWLIHFGIVAEDHPLHVPVGEWPDSYGYKYDGSLICKPGKRSNVEYNKQAMGKYVSPGMIIRVELDFNKASLSFTVGGPSNNPNLVQPPIFFHKIDTQIKYRLAASLDYSYTAVTLLPRGFSFEKSTETSPHRATISYHVGSSSKSKEKGFKWKIKKFFGGE